MLPARIPNLLVNGATGIAVGMATNIPPHNLGEVCTALVKLLDNEDLSSVQLCRYIKGPDFPTGGQILNSPDELKEIYKTGSGSIRLRATWDLGPETRDHEDDSHRQRALHRQQIGARRADRRSRAEPQAAAAARCQGPVHGGRADCARDEEGRRREDDHGVPLQAHPAPDQLCGQPDLPHPDRESRGRTAGTARSQIDPLALPALPSRGGHGAAGARTGGAQQAHSHPRGIRAGLRRARRDPASDPEI